MKFAIETHEAFSTLARQWHRKSGRLQHEEQKAPYKNGAENIASKEGETGRKDQSARRKVPIEHGQNAQAPE